MKPKFCLSFFPTLGFEPGFKLENVGIQTNFAFRAGLKGSNLHQKQRQSSGIEVIKLYSLQSYHNL